jgi:hypothetical protein
VAASKRGVKRPVKPKSAAKKSQKKAENQDELAGAAPERVKCEARTQSGNPCPRWALPDSTLCAQHLNPKSAGGRPTKLTKQITDDIVELLQKGGYAETAAVAAGISKRTFYEWMERGNPTGTKAADEEYRVFRRRVEEARAKGEQVRVEQVLAGAATDWRAAAWYLERTNPERWGGPRSRNVSRGVHPDDFAGGEPSSEDSDGVVDNQLSVDGRPL